jgi:phosphomannomutase
MIGVSGVRGRVDQDFTPRLISTFAHAFGRFAEGGKIVIGRDTRPSGEMCRYALLSGLLYSGCEVIDLGICPTPTVIYMVKALNAAGGVAVTASHNPIEWNALKLIGGDGFFLDRDAMERLLAEFQLVSEVTRPETRLGSLSFYSEGIDRHIESILGLKLLDVGKIHERGFRVALDCVNGAGAAMTPKLLSSLGCEVLPLFCELTGEFSRGPEPVAGNLGKLSEFVRETGADIGMAHDPDADRLSLVDETGRALGEEMTLALAVRFVLGKKRGPVATNLSTSMLIDDIAGEYGVQVHRTGVGEINVAHCLERIGGVIGGEGNGGVILPELHLTRDAPLAVALILQYLADTGLTLSSLVDELPKYVMIKEKVEIREGQEVDLGAIRDAMAGAKIDERDGLKLIWDKEWVHIRKSGTEPIVRIIAEAENEDRVTQLYNEFKGLIVSRV